ncbi:hypothetical protein [Rugamonas violacea]|uniref:hypothetical protein n=1 Tax=Rugamonas sp. CCM 8940 TaxID=2765359 RepID=UPI0018F31A80|nr:hypothetical protein [Rugamonas sp. CCM 8940]MBJ7311479.1 hypothetical protein [Rugamonas sp. CCM 8940]
MTSGMFAFCRFHLLRLFHAQPVLSLVVMFNGVAALAALLIWMGETHAVASAQQQLLQLRGQSQRLEAGQRAAPPAKPIAPVLPWFDSASLVGQFSHIAGEAKLPLDEVAYVLEEGGNQPYLRYRVTMTVSAAYPVIRRFADDVAATASNVDLDTIACQRADVSTPVLSCELAFSAFFRKDGHG